MAILSAQLYSYTGKASWYWIGTQVFPDRWIATLSLVSDYLFSFCGHKTALMHMLLPISSPSCNWVERYYGEMPYIYTPWVLIGTYVNVVNHEIVRQSKSLQGYVRQNTDTTRQRGGQKRKRRMFFFKYYDIQTDIVTFHWASIH